MSDRRVVELVAHDPAWASRALGYADALRAALGSTILEIHHIGSTAIPAIKAKPTVDLLPLVHSLDELDGKAQLIRDMGYEWRGEFGIAGRRFCPLTDPANGKRLVNVHFFVNGAAEVERHLSFRDYLRAHPDQARAYEAEKERAAALHPDDMVAYTDAKGPWITACEARAIGWARAR